jgi:uncharacterized phage-associated protein
MAAFERPYRPLAFANEFIVMSRPDGAEHMKLQKLVYIAYGWWLAFHDKPILSEQPQVWTHGPVFKRLYHTLKHFGRRSIESTQRETPFEAPPRVHDGDEEVHQLLDWVWERYGAQSSFALSDLTHRPGSPWRQVATRYNFKVPQDTHIPVDVIRDHYRKLAVDYDFEGDESATPW